MTDANGGGSSTGRDDGGPCANHAQRLADARGGLPAAALGARDLAQLARNPHCDRLLLHRATQLDPVTVVRALFRSDALDVGSRIAFTTGLTFEKVLLRDRARAVFDLFRGSGRFTSGAETFVDVEELHPGTDPGSLHQRETATRDFLDRRLVGDPAAPTMIWHPRLALSIDGFVADQIHIEPDFLLAGAGAGFYKPGEVKSYRDRGPRTNAAELTVARLQGAIEVLALRDTVRSVRRAAGAALSTSQMETLVPDGFDLVLRGRYGMRPTLRSLVIRREITTMATILGGIRGRVLRVLDERGEGLNLNTQAGHRSVPNHLLESCREHCAFAESCYNEARAAGLPIVLGAAMEEAVGAIGSLPRLVALLEGSEATGDDERRVVHAFRDAHLRTNHEVRRAG